MSNNTPRPVAPGYYPDPEGNPSIVRWWDGSQWTSATRPATASNAAIGAPRRSRRGLLIGIGAGVVGFILLAGGCVAVLQGADGGSDGTRRPVQRLATSTDAINSCHTAVTDKLGAQPQFRDDNADPVDAGWVVSGYVTPLQGAETQYRCEVERSGSQAVAREVTVQ